jgi:hypothetical protein
MIENVNIATGGVGFSDLLGLCAVVCAGMILGSLLVCAISYVSFNLRSPGIYHVPKFTKYLHLFFVYGLSQLRIKLGLPSEKTELLFEQLLLESIGQNSGKQRSHYDRPHASKEEAHRPNEKEMSDGGHRSRTIRRECASAKTRVAPGSRELDEIQGRASLGVEV